MKTAFIVIVTVYLVIGLLTFGALAALSTVTGHAPDWKGAVIGGLTWPYAVFRLVIG